MSKKTSKLARVLLAVTMTLGLFLGTFVPALADDLPGWRPATPTGASSLVVGLSANPGTDSVTYTIRAANRTSNMYAGLTISALVPPGTQLLESWSGQWGANKHDYFDGQRIAWSIKTINPGGMSPIFVYTVSWDGKSQLDNRATLGWSRPNTGGYTRQDGVLVRETVSGIETVKGPVERPAAAKGEIPPWKSPTGFEPSLSVGMSSNVGTDAVTFVVRVRNNTDGAYSGLTVAALVPGGTTLLESWSGSWGKNSHDYFDGQRIAWNLPRLNPGGVSPIYVFSVGWDGKSPLQTRATVGYARPNVGWIDPDGGIHREALSSVLEVKGPAERPAAAMGQIPRWAPVTGFEPGVAVQLTANPGKNSVTFTMRVRNNTTTPYTGITISGLVPGGTSLIESWSGSWGKNSHNYFDGQRIAWSFPMLAPRGMSPIFVYTVAWDGKSSLQSRAMAGWGKPRSGWLSEDGVLHLETLSSIVEVKP